MVNYQNAKIYKIVCNITNAVYYGSTCQTTLAQRLAKHVSDYKSYLNGGTVSCGSSYYVLEHEDYYIELCESCPCASKDELSVYERRWIETNDCVNYNIPGRTKEEWKQTYKEHIKTQGKEYRDSNKEHFQQYRRDNRDRINARSRLYRENNKEKVKSDATLYYQRNKELLSAKIQCECGVVHAVSGISQHKRSQKHITYCESIS